MLSRSGCNDHSVVTSKSKASKEMVRDMLSRSGCDDYSVVTLYPKSCQELDRAARARLFRRHT